MQHSTYQYLQGSLIGENTNFYYPIVNWIDSPTLYIGRVQFQIRYVRLWDLHNPREKWLNYLQTVETLIRCHILQRLIWVCTVCQVTLLGVSWLQWGKTPNWLGFIHKTWPLVNQFSLETGGPILRVLANSGDPDQTPQNAASDRVSTLCK